MRTKKWNRPPCSTFTGEIYFACEWANGLPRKILGYRTPNELFEKELDRIYKAS